MVTHILFADDTLIFCDALPTQIGKLRDILASLRLGQGCILIWLNSNWFRLVMC